MTAEDGQDDEVAQAKMNYGEYDPRDDYRSSWSDSVRNTRFVTTCNWLRSPDLAVAVSNPVRGFLTLRDYWLRTQEAIIQHAESKL